MIFSQYGDYFYLYILLLTSIPAVILGLMGKNIKYYVKDYEDVLFDLNKEH